MPLAGVALATMAPVGAQHSGATIKPP